MTKIKICGLTRTEDIMACISNGVELIGINFYPASPRYLKKQDAINLLDSVSIYRNKFKTIGVFVNASFSEILEIANSCHLDAIQLHGDESPDDLIRLREAGFHVYKAFRGSSNLNLINEFIIGEVDKTLPSLLIDAYHPKLMGGTGTTLQRADLKMIRNAITKNIEQKKLNIILAGGLNSENVISLVQYVQPWGVDTASGVELTPGIKDPKKIKQFCSQVRKSVGSGGKL